MRRLSADQPQLNLNATLICVILHMSVLVTTVSTQLPVFSTVDIDLALVTTSSILMTGLGYVFVGGRGIYTRICNYNMRHTHDQAATTGGQMRITLSPRINRRSKLRSVVCGGRGGGGYKHKARGGEAERLARKMTYSNGLLHRLGIDSDR